MTPLETKLLLRSACMGTAIALAVLAVDTIGLLEPLERWLYDTRTLSCQRFNPPPTNRLVHIDIDDRSLEAIGTWPWPRQTLAEIIDELREAGVGALALDVLFVEPQAPRYAETPDGGLGLIEDDALLARAVRSFGNVIIPFAVSLETPRTEAQQRMRDLLRIEPTLPHPQVLDKLATEGFNPSGDVGREAGVDDYLKARRDAVRSRLSEQLATQDLSLDGLTSLLIPGVDPTILGGSPLRRVIETQYNRVRSINALERFARPASEAALHAVPAGIELPAIAVLCEAAGGTGFVNYMPDGDGVVRSVPLIIEHAGKLYPQLGLALACASLGVDLDGIGLNEHKLTLPTEHGVITIPVRRRLSQKLGGDVPAVMMIPWFGTGDWSVMYDPPAHREPRNHMPISRVWGLGELRRRMKQNDRNADDALLALLHVLDQQRFDTYIGLDSEQRTPEVRSEIIRWTLDELDRAGWLDAYAGIPENQLTPDDLKLIRSASALRIVLEHNDVLGHQLATERADLRTALRGKAAIIGWTATATAADYVSTSLHSECPGVVVHGTVFNAIVTGHVLRPTGAWSTWVMTLLLALTASAVVARMPPLPAGISVLAVAGGYLAFNGIVLFDYADTVVRAAAPVTAALTTWAGCTVTRFVQERAERTRITRRFRSYVDPALVNYVLDHPNLARLDGQMRELTVGFTDLAGFTGLTERLREKTVPMLSQYMERMVPILRSHNGYVNKFLGDGIMFFFGAPVPSSSHALDAVTAALEMKQAMDLLAQDPATGELGRLGLRCGIATGQMVVGDAGPADACDYTVLGDTVNLASRLESANKALGTQTLVTARTAELIGDHYLMRPIARLRVIGKTEGVMVYEPLTIPDTATKEQRQLVGLTQSIVTAYTHADFHGCLDLLNQLEETRPGSRLAGVYRKACKHYMDNPPEGEFDGQIILEEK